MKALTATLSILTVMGLSLAGCLGQPGKNGTPSTNPTSGGDGPQYPDFATHEFMQDPAVRVALSYIFPYEESRTEVYQGYLLELPGPIPKGMPFYDTQTQKFTTDLDKAAEALDAAGYTEDGNGERFGGEALRIFYNTGNTQREQNAQLFKQNLAEVGINADVEPLAWPLFLERMFETRNWDIMFLGWAPDYNDPDDYWFPFAASEEIEGQPDLHGDTFHTGYSNAELDKLLLEGKYSVNAADRRQAYQDAFDLYMEEPSLIFIGQTVAVDTYRDWVQGYVYNPMVSTPGYFHDFSKAAGAKNPDTFVYASFGDPKNLDPADAYDAASGLVIQNVYDTLVRYEGAETKEVAPRLALSWTTSDDGKEWTFKLREDVTFSNGNPFTADDVVYSFDRVIKLGSPESGVNWIVTQFLEEGNVTKVDDHTVKFTLKTAYGGFLPAISYTVGSIIDKETCEEHGGMPKPNATGEFESEADKGCAVWLKENMVGTNAFKLQKWEKNTEVVLAQNTGYWDGWAGNHVKTAVIRNIEEPNTRILALTEGTADFAEIDLDKLDQIEGKPGVKLTTGDSYSVVLGILQTKPEVK